MKYADVKFVLLLLFCDLYDHDINFRMGKINYKMSVIIGKGGIECKLCKEGVERKSPVIVSPTSMLSPFYHVNCIEWKKDIKILNKIPVGKSSIIPKWP